MGGQIRIGILDPYTIVRDSLKLFLETVDDFQFAGEAETFAEAIELCQTCSPHVLLCDFLETGSHRVHCVCTLHQVFPQLHIVVLTTEAHIDHVIEILRMGVNGYLIKNGSIEALIEAISAAAAGLTVIDEEIDRRLTQHPDILPSNRKIVSS